MWILIGVGIALIILIPAALYYFEYIIWHTEEEIRKDPAKFFGYYKFKVK